MAPQRLVVQSLSRSGVTVPRGPPRSWRKFGLLGQGLRDWGDTKRWGAVPEAMHFQLSRAMTMSLTNQVSSPSAIFLGN